MWCNLVQVGVGEKAQTLEIPPLNYRERKQLLNKSQATLKVRELQSALDRLHLFHPVFYVQGTGKSRVLAFLQQRGMGSGGNSKCVAGFTNW